MVRKELVVDLGTILLMAGLAYGLGVLWYSLLPAKLPDKVWRVAAYPFIGIFVAEALLPNVWESDPKFGGVYLFAALIGSIVAVIVDWLIAEVRKPVAETRPRVSETAAR